MSRAFKFLLDRKVDIIKILFLAAIILFSSYEKYKVFDESGGDFEIYRNSVRSLLKGENPYEYTVKSYTFFYDENGNPLEHGFAYLPTLMYVQAPLYNLSTSTGLPLQRVWKVPLLIVDIGIAVLLICFLYKKSYLATIFATIVWSFHPFFYQVHSYTNWEPYPIFFLLLALLLLEKKEGWSAFFYALSISFKTFPVILFPVFFFKSKNKVRFILIGALVALLISIPFFKSGEDLSQYVNGAFFVHGDRELQGRPLLTFLSYYTPLDFNQIGNVKTYVYLAILAPWIVSLFLLLKKKMLSVQIITSLSFLLYYLFTPVLGRTHLMWGIPFFILGSFEVAKRKRWLYYVLLLSFYMFYVWYLEQWFRGFRFEGDLISL